MPRARSWKELWPGAVALLLVVGVAASIVTFARVGALRGATVRLYAVTPHARGILPGSEVWLAGRKVGLIREVGFRPPSTDTSHRVLLTLDVLADAGSAIGRTAPVAIRAGGNLIGAPVLAISPTSSAMPRIRGGDTLVADPGSELESIRTRLTTTVGTEVPVILDNIRVLDAQLRSASGTLGALGVEGPRRIGTTAGAASALLGRATRGRGTVALTLGRGDVTARAHAIVARVAELRARAGTTTGTVGRLRTDSSLVRALQGARASLDTVQALLDEPRGTAGRATSDRALQLEVARARAELELLFADVRRNPLRYVTP